VVANPCRGEVHVEKGDQPAPEFLTVEQCRKLLKAAQAHKEGLLGPWLAISHFFRKTGSYGLTAEQFGNSESIIKLHYQGRVTSEDIKRFYGLTPQTKEKRQPQSGSVEVVWCSLRSVHRCQLFRRAGG
jgi:hypothetical protein